jgi:hypothetical protein
MIEKQDFIDFTTLPKSKGIGRGTMVILAIGVLMIFVMGGLASFMSGYGHRWPSMQTVREPLGNMPTTQQ